MLRPTSQHLFYLAAEAERLSLLVYALQEWDRRATELAAGKLDEAEGVLRGAAKALLEAGNLLKESQ